MQCQIASSENTLFQDGLLSGDASGNETNRVRFVPNPGYPDELAGQSEINGSSSFTFLAWNETVGAAGENVDATDSGNESLSEDSALAMMLSAAVFGGSIISATESFIICAGFGIVGMPSIAKARFI